MPADRTVRLQKYISERGLASRRAAGEIIKAGRVCVDGKIVLEPGARIDPERARITFNGDPVATAVPSTKAILLNKPRGYICSRKSQSAKSSIIYDLPGIDPSLLPAGRLDRDSEGLLILSNDGDLIHSVTHPQFEHEKVYEVDVRGPVTAHAMKTLRSRLTIDGYRIRPARVRACGSEKSRLEFTLFEGRNRQIRKMCSLAGLRIAGLKRIGAYGLELGGLRTGQWRALTDEEMLLLGSSSPGE